MIVAEYKFGNSTCKVDDSCLKYQGKEQMKPVLERIAAIVYRDQVESQQKQGNT